MALTTKEGTKKEIEKLAHIELFTNEFSPVLERLNEVLSKYNLGKDIIYLGWSGGKIQPFIDYSLFPSVPKNKVEDL